jgi:hypothetical protein
MEKVPSMRLAFPWRSFTDTVREPDGKAVRALDEARGADVDDVVVMGSARNGSANAARHRVSIPPGNRSFRENQSMLSQVHALWEHGFSLWPAYPRKGLEAIAATHLVIFGNDAADSVAAKLPPQEGEDGRSMVD